jgi:PAS domain-containing protein
LAGFCALVALSVFRVFFVMGDTFSTSCAGDNNELKEFVAAAANHPSALSLYDTMEFTGQGIRGEPERYGSLSSLNMLDSSTDEKPFNRITKLMTEVFKTPVSLITLVADPSRVWFKSKVGPFGACVDRDGSWCNYVLVPATPEILITEDASKDARLAHNPYVAGEPFIKFYAGAPLVGSRGERYGTLCIVDLKQRAFSAELYALLNNFAALAVEEIERNKPLFDIAVGEATNDVQKNRHLDMSLTGSREGIVMLDVRETGWPISYANPSFETSSGLELDDLAGGDFWDLFECPGKGELDLASIVGNGTTFETHVRCNVSGRWMTLRLMPATTDRFAPSKATGIPGWVPSVDAPQGVKLGLDVDEDKVVDIGMRDLMDVPDAKCFWFAMVLECGSGEGVKGSASDNGSSAATRSGSGSSKTGSTISGFSSGFGEYDPPASLGKVRLGPLLGSGSFGKVYRSVANGMPVAIKVIDCRGRGEGATASQLDEVKLTRDLDHPGVVKMFGYSSSKESYGGEDLTVVWMVQELCDMGQLSDAAERGWLRVKRDITAPPDMATVLATLRDIACAMAYVHSKDIIHADLTGRNVLLASSESSARGFTAKVCDFGLSRITRHGEAIPTDVLGTLTHMSPEILSDNVISPLADVWSFGVIAWEAYHGKKCYCGKHPPQIIMTVVKNIPLPWPDDTPEEFNFLMKRVLAYDCEHRPQFTDVINDLDSLSSMNLTVATDPSEHVLRKKYNGANADGSPGVN